jgi:hypothetical protein
LRGRRGDVSISKLTNSIVADLARAQLKCAYLNLALPLVQLAEPSAPRQHSLAPVSDSAAAHADAKKTTKPKKAPKAFTEWDEWTINLGPDVTLQQFLEAVAAKFGKGFSVAGLYRDTGNSGSGSGSGGGSGVQEVVYQSAPAFKNLNAWKLGRKLRDLLDLRGDPSTNTPSVLFSLALVYKDRSDGSTVPLQLPPGVNCPPICVEFWRAPEPVLRVDENNWAAALPAVALCTEAGVKLALKPLRSLFSKSNKNDTGTAAAATVVQSSLPSLSAASSNSSVAESTATSALSPSRLSVLGSESVVLQDGPLGPLKGGTEALRYLASLAVAQPASRFADPSAVASALAQACPTSPNAAPEAARRAQQWPKAYSLYPQDPAARARCDQILVAAECVTAAPPPTLTTSTTVASSTCSPSGGCLYELLHVVPSGGLVPKHVVKALRDFEKQVAQWLADASGGARGGLFGGARASCADLAVGIPLYLARLRHRAFWQARPGPAAEFSMIV